MEFPFNTTLVVTHKFGCLTLMPKIQPQCTSHESNLRDRLLDEVENNSFIGLPGKGGHSGLLSSKTMCPNLGGIGEAFL